MKTKIIFTVASLLLLSVSSIVAQGLERKNIESFKEININGTADVYLSNSDEASISAKSDEFRLMNYSVKDGVLELNTGAVDAIYVNLTALTSIQTNGSANIYSSDTLKGDQLNILSNGTGNLNLITKYSIISANINGATNVKLSGDAEQLNANVTGTGSLKAYKLKVNNSIVTITGAGNAQVNVSNKLSGSISGTGTLYHRGDPKELEVEVSGAGEIKKSNSLTVSDTTKLKFGNKTIIILEGEENTEVEIGDDVLVEGKKNGETKSSKPKMPSIWSGFELGINGYLNADNTLNMDSVNTNWALNYGKSVAVNFNFWEARGRILKENIIVTTGLGAEINNYRFENKVKLLSDTIPTIALLESDKDYDKSKLVTGFLNVPLYLTFATNKFKNGKRLSISPGVTGGWRFTSYNKRIVNENGDRNKSRNRDDFNLNPFRLNASVRIGYGDFILFANYSLTPLFQKNEGPLLTPVTIGIRVIGFGKS